MSYAGKFSRSRCPKGKLPEIRIASDHFLMFRCPAGCDQNVSIDGPMVEEGDGGHDVYTFFYECPKCGEEIHLKQQTGPHSIHTGSEMTFSEQAEHWEKRREGVLC